MPIRLTLEQPCWFRKRLSVRCWPRAVTDTVVAPLTLFDDELERPIAHRAAFTVFSVPHACSVTNLSKVPFQAKNWRPPGSLSHTT